ncbi:flagellar hook-basal body complex protein [Bacillaceae bacterium Marseille-Q3522]|nr:flagellar hook-basal body complex protein [Bacillaceae bacterium Marseille-Q3522]
MLRSMYSGISGMKNFQTKLDVIGNNIANVNTYGFKKGRVTFKDAMNQMINGAVAAQNGRGGTNPKQVGLGSTLATIDTIHGNSNLQTTGRTLDVGLDGDGYFVVRSGDQFLYTRAGNLYLDDFGNIVNGDGYPVQAYAVDETGNLTDQIGDVAVNVNAEISATPTTEITINGALSDVATNDSEYIQQIKLVDNAGESHRMEMRFVKAADNQWNVFLGDDQIGDITFDADTGAVTGNTVNWTDTNYAPINFDFAGLTETGNQNTAIVEPNGNSAGVLESFNIGYSGEINAIYSNGLVSTLGYLTIAKFSNTSGLLKAGSNLFQESVNSGTPNLGIAGDGRGAVSSGSLEMSNVDLAEEFTDMITAQRGFQANTRIITTSDEILQELVNLKR